MDILGSIRVLFEKIRTDPHIGGIFGALSGALFVVWLVEMSIELGTSLHWGLGASMTAVAGILLAWFAVKTASYREDDSISIILVYFCFSVLLGAVVCSGFSYVLQIQEWASYDDAPPQASMQTFRRYYLWTFADMVPAINIWKTFPVPSPIAPADAMAGVPVLIFRLFVLGYVFASITRWWKLQGRKHTYP